MLTQLQLAFFSSDMIFYLLLYVRFSYQTHRLMKMYSTIFIEKKVDQSLDSYTQKYIYLTYSKMTAITWTTYCEFKS